MVEVLIERDEEGRVQVVTLYGDDSPEGLAAAVLVEAPVLGMKHYLHLDPEVSREGTVLRYRVDRSDLFLDRELDAILETMVLGLKALSQDRPGKVAVREVGLDVLV
ncbi:MAG: hypothetical protein N2507_02045 [Candidatus Bipolaricaulota bacterium]|nr:hypothetical protein [Candidatus Bipolaricaulota bacterium]MCX7844131.1 hypothetical protein [Candidatus Bipolaricaulota bacterium]MDW8152280.1 hypothetical protein [Candidatus Bipolaricaulota bacterium]